MDIVGIAVVDSPGVAHGLGLMGGEVVLLLATCRNGSSDVPSGVPFCRPMPCYALPTFSLCNCHTSY